METTASVPVDTVKDVTDTTQTESAANALAEEVQKNEGELASEVAPEPTPESAGPRRSTRFTSTTASKVPAPPATEKKRRGPKKRSADEAGKDEGAAGAPEKGAAKKTKTDSESTKELAIGDSLPAMTLKNEKGEDVNIRELITDSGLVLFLVPKADTSGCTQQACGYRDIYPDFEAVNYKVYCLSADSPTAQEKWQTKKSLPYPLLSDPKRELVGALTGVTTRTPRSHFIFEKGGKLIERRMPVKPVDSPKLAIAFVKEHTTSATPS